MATIRPFRGLRYHLPDLNRLVAPPYDVISQTQRAELAAQSPHNVVGLTLPETNADDRSKFVKYARSAARLQQWVDEEALKPEDAPSFYRLRQTFTTPDGQQFTRTALVALIKVEPYANGVVLPHEQTFPKHKEDRLRILEATRAHLECIYGLFEDPAGDLFEAISQSPASAGGKVTTPDGVIHELEVISDPETCAKLTESMASRKVWIADGHHRYETALTFREALGERPGAVPEDYMMMALSSISDPGLVLLPTHRMLKRGPEDLVSRLNCDWWTVTSCPNDDLVGAIEGKKALAVALPGGSGLILEIRDLEAAIAAVKGEGSRELKALDVTLLHDLVFDQCLELTGHEFFDYTRDPQEALDAVNHGSPASFLMNPPTVADMQEIAIGGEKMPQKSTYYSPKIISGLILWRLADF